MNLMTKVRILVHYFKIKITDHVLRGVNYSLLKYLAQEFILLSEKKGNEK